MKPTLMFFLLLIPFVSYSQNPEEWQALEFNNKEDYKANESKILECANFILNVPAEASDPARQSALTALSKWMSGTPDYNFVIDDSIGKLMEKNEAVLSIYMASMARYVLENKDKSPTAKEIELNAFKSLLEYSEDLNNKVPQSKELKKAIVADKKGKLEAYLGL